MTTSQILAIFIEAFGFIFITVILAVAIAGFKKK